MSGNRALLPETVLVNQCRDTFTDCQAPRFVLPAHRLLPAMLGRPPPSLLDTFHLSLPLIPSPPRGLIGKSHLCATFPKECVPATRQPAVDDSNRNASPLVSSIELVDAAPVDIVRERRLAGLVEQAGTEHQMVHLGAHEAPVGILWRAYNRFSHGH